MDKGGRRVISVLLILLLWLGPIQHRAESLQPMEWQKYYFKGLFVFKSAVEQSIQHPRPLPSPRRTSLASTAIRLCSYPRAEKTRADTQKRNASPPFPRSVSKSSSELGFDI